jgi:3-oxoadipate enol-lactonase
MRWTELGSGPPLVMAGALGTSRALWERVQSRLAKRFRIISYDLPGHGDSPPVDGDCSVARLGAGVIGLLDELGIARAGFCGLSMGGATGMWLATNAPERIDRLVLACTSTRFGTAEAWRERARTVRTRGLEPVVESAPERWFTEAFRAAHPEQVEPVAAFLQGVDPGSYAALCDVIADWDFDGLGRIAAPALVISADADPVSPPADGRRIADGIPGASLVVLERCSHLAHVEQPLAVGGLIEEHMAA